MSRRMRRGAGITVCLLAMIASMSSFHYGGNGSFGRSAGAQATCGVPIVVFADDFETPPLSNFDTFPTTTGWTSEGMPRIRNIGTGQGAWLTNGQFSGSISRTLTLPSSAEGTITVDVQVLAYPVSVIVDGVSQVSGQGPGSVSLSWLVPANTGFVNLTLAPFGVGGVVESIAVSYTASPACPDPTATNPPEPTATTGAATEVPTEPGAATPIATATATAEPTNPGEPSNPSVPSAPSNPSGTSGGTTVTTLPNTGTGQAPSTAQFAILLAASGVVLLAGLAGWRRHAGTSPTRR